jgi:hypothetical protein
VARSFESPYKTIIERGASSEAKSSSFSQETTQF